MMLNQINSTNELKEVKPYQLELYFTVCHNELSVERFL